MKKNLILLKTHIARRFGINNQRNTAAHELRTPLQHLISLSQRVKNKTKDKEPKELLEIVIKNAEVKGVDRRYFKM